MKYHFCVRKKRQTESQPMRQAEIHASYGDVVKISIVNISNNETEYIYTMNISDFITEIKFVYARYIEDVKEINEDILNTQFIARTNELYRDFLETISGLR